MSVTAEQLDAILALAEPGVSAGKRLQAARARIAELDGEITKLQDERARVVQDRDALQAQVDALAPQLATILSQQPS